MGRICIYCRKQKEDDGFAVCSACREKFRENKRNYWQERKAKGLCAGCGKPKKNDGYSRCLECRKKYAERSKQIREAWRSRKRCPWCKEPYDGEDGHIYCPKCMAYLRGQWEDKRKEHRENHLCSLCGSPLDEDKHRICAACRTKLKETRLKRLAAGPVCAKCFKPKEADGYKCCPECRRTVREYLKNKKERVK